MLSIHDLPLNNEAGRLPSASKNDGDRSKLEEKWLEQEKWEVEKANNHQHQELKKVFAHRTFWLTATWMAFVCLMVFLAGFELHHCEIHFLHCTFRLTDTVLVALISATAIFGLLGVILDGLFRHKRQKETQS